MSETAGIASAGKPTTVTPSATKVEIAAQENSNTLTQSQGEDLNTQTDNSANAKPVFKDEDLAEYLKSKGVDYSGSIDDVISKLKPQGAEPTAEEIERKNSLLEKRMLDKFISGGGKVEDFTSVKQLLNADVTEVSKGVLKKELLDAGFDEDDAKAIIKQRYLQHDLDALVYDEDGDETKEEFDKKKAKLEKEVFYGAGVLANHSLPIKQKAESIWNNLKQEIELEDADLAMEAKYSAEVDTHVKSLPKQVTFSIGQVDGKDIAPIVYNVPEEIHQEVKALFADRQKREEFFLDADGNINLQNVADIIVRNKILEKVVEQAGKETFIKGRTSQVKELEKVFPYRSATQVGIGGTLSKNNGDKKPITKSGTPQRV